MQRHAEPPPVYCTYGVYSVQLVLEWRTCGRACGGTVSGFKAWGMANTQLTSRR